MTEIAESDLANRLQDSLTLMATNCSVDMSLWSDHCGVVLEAVDALNRWTALLTPSGYTKHLYHGEFCFPQTLTDEYGEEHTHKVFVPWTTVKEIMDFIRVRGTPAHPTPSSLPEREQA